MPGSVPVIVAQHVEGLALLWSTRRTLATSGHLSLTQLARFDHRIAAHEDGCVIAGDAGMTTLVGELQDANAARLFAVGVVAIQTKRRDIFDRCLKIAEALPAARAGLTSALGWVDAPQLAGVASDLLKASLAFRRSIGLAACRVHRIDPGQVLFATLTDSDSRAQAEALRTAGVLGNPEHASSCLDALSSENSRVRFWAAWSSVLLGDRRLGLNALVRLAEGPSSHGSEAFGLALQALSTSAGHETLTSLAGASELLRSLIRGTGIVGEPSYVPWLISHMSDEKTARLAGEALSLLAGADLALLDLERKPPENFESGPNDDPDDPNVDMDADDGLPWPDAAKIEQWWAANGSRFQKGTRYFMGQPVTKEHCIHVLKTGYQRQRILAAHYLCLLDPGTPLFNTSAPAWRQQRLLATM
ncbi:MAG: TIGR02270 family protein [Vicinamibacterales bacterium]